MLVLQIREHKRRCQTNSLQIQVCIIQALLLYCLVVMKRLRVTLIFLALFANIGFIQSSAASGAGQVGAQLLDVPPETKIKMLRIVLEDLFGTPAEIRAQFIVACDTREKLKRLPSEKVKHVSTSLPSTSSDVDSNLSKDAVLAAFCSAAVRKKIELALLEKPIPSSKEKQDVSPTTSKSITQRSQ